MGIPEEKKSLKPPKGGIPPSFTIGGKFYVVTSVNVITDEVVILEKKTGERYRFDFYKLREKIDRLSE